MAFVTPTEYTLSRLITLASAIALIVLSALALAAGGTAGHIVLNAVILAGAALGLIGVLQDHPGFLRLFELLLVCIFVFNFIYLFVSAFSYGATAHSLAYDIVTVILLAVAIAAVHVLLRPVTSGFMGFYRRPAAAGYGGGSSLAI